MTTSDVAEPKTPMRKLAEGIWRFVANSKSEIGFLMAQAIIVATFMISLGNSWKMEEVKLARDVYREFYLERPIYRKIWNAIEACKPLYKPWGGEFNHVQINDYLGFFSDLGFLVRRDILAVESVRHLFGAFIIEAYEYPELQRYIEAIRKNHSQPDAFGELEELVALVKKDSRFSKLAANARTMCSQPEGEKAK